MNCHFREMKEEENAVQVSGMWLTAIDVGSGNGWVLVDDQPLPDPMSAQTYNTQAPLLTPFGAEIRIFRVT